MSDTGGSILQLSESQRETLQSFQEIASINDEYLCMQILQQNSWDLNLALSQFMGQGTEEAAPVPSSRSDGNVVRRANRNVDASSGSQRATLSVANQAERERPAADTAPNGLFGLLFIPIRWLFQARPISLNPNQDTERFIDDYNLRVSPTHPNFHTGSYQSAVATAFERSKFLLVYLHSPLHEDTPRFCRGVLSAPGVVNYANENLITWAGRVWDPEAYGLSTQLRATTFPFVALLVCQSSRSVQIADRIQGYVEENVLLERIQNSVNAFNSVISQNQLEQQRREQAVQLRAQQDREYREAAEADRLATIRQREEEERREAEEEENRQREELEAAQEMSRQLTQQDTIRKLKTAFDAIPEPEAAPAVSAVRFQLPSGKKLSRRFGKTETVQRLYDYLTLVFHETPEDEKKIVHFSVSTQFPKLELTDMTQTIEAVGLHPRGMLYVQDLDA
uniref:UBX domain-containing protein n=1 Tax=Spumella elongata TaxID=89044 RepID=A0A7S3MDT0_9STRA|mmetsp:Transcript_57048/g.100140  ORF Transcript_57048/g.100140 Transcript_57048/m.100140 type:complete len:451 (+) Transcript_57048:60-1412(+)|eukprot:CAMPEP_0184987572 /NCGR_PEP_ID=MMETSP1098-20130426/21149_1 /TAXON_ID=89044 /ORGANISM="Spumella elongata, Strain CCAP 955/1" /LENGTH=450 /DNA_ID=CAMNT_0027512125 /DNA_START=37 /DNA_END=1389 /DNA_ORIENTATION=+